MPSYKLTYFDARGRAEIARLLFAAAGAKYEDNRIKDGEWATVKPTTPLGCVPVLEVDGKPLIESQAINRYLAREFGFYGKTNMESTQIDIVTDVVGDMWGKLTSAYLFKDEPAKIEKLKGYFTDDFPKKMAYLEKTCGDSYFVGKSLTLADVAFIQFMEYYLWPGQNDNGLDKYPKLKAIKENTCSNVKIAAWVSERPTSKF